MEGLLSFLGRLHPVILHLPIGFMFLAFMMEVHSRWKQNTTFKSAITFSLFWGMIGSILAAGSGYLLSLNGGYEEELLFNHKYLGIGVAIVSIVLYFINVNHNKSENKFYLPVFSLTILAVLLTGHFGGSLTHGSDFLLSNSESKNSKPQIVDIENALVFDDLVFPIVEAKCVRCHSQTKTKGDLLMATKEGMITGGKTGPLFIAGDIKNSLMLQRIHLPIEEKEHMPPKGKKQLLVDEIEILSWWITEGADFNARVKELPKSESIQKSLQKFIAPADDFAGITVDRISDAELQKIKNKGIPIFRVDNESAFVEVDLSRKKDLDRSTLNMLKSIGKQTIGLHLESSNIQDKDLGILKRFPHLQKLYLQQTSITDEGIKHLKDLQYLNYLNIYGTAVTDKSFEIFNQLSRLKDLYLWQTEVTDAGVIEFKNSKPKTNVNVGIDESIFGDARLKPPLIIAEKDLFSDSLLVELKTNFKNVNLHYSTDGTDPDSTSLLYDTLFVLTETTQLKVISIKDGWTSSEVNSRQFARVKYTPENITLATAPNDRYKANGAKSLIDLEKGSATFTDGNWIGYEKEHVVATLDLGKSNLISSVTVGALESPGSYIFFPKGIQIDLSENGKKYRQVVSKRYPTATENSPTKLANYTESFDEQTARFVRVKVESNLVNPEWHPAPGAPCWVFIDEISVE